MRLVYSFQNRQTVFECASNKIVVGRPKMGVPIDLDLSPDTSVSRPHARISEIDGKWWIEDLDSAGGTQVGDIDIKGKGMHLLNVGDTVRIGKTTLRVESARDRADAPFDAPATVQLEGNDRLSVEKTVSPDQGPMCEGVQHEIVGALDASMPSVFGGRANAAEQAKRLLFELPIELAQVGRPDSLFQMIVERVVPVIAGATRGALLVIDNPCGKLLLKAHHPSDEPVVSTTMALRAIQSREAFIWQRRLAPGRAGAGDLSAVPTSLSEQRVEAVMYAPLMWREEVLGVICLDSGRKHVNFQPEDLQLLLAVAQYAALAVANHQLQQALSRESATRTNLLRQFSPKIARQLVASRGRVRLGGQRSDVTILCSDVRGFTSLSEKMEPDEVVEMLNEYFSQLIPIIFSHDGTVDKFVGDGILAIFGSPEPDADHQEKAVRAAFEMQIAMRDLNVKRKERRNVICEVGIGIHAGEVVHGFIGTEDRMEFTAIGDAVNRASRYCDAARGGEVLMSPAVHQHVWQFVEVQRTSIPTKHEGELPAFRLTGFRLTRQTPGLEEP